MRRNFNACPIAPCFSAAHKNQESARSPPPSNFPPTARRGRAFRHTSRQFTSVVMPPRGSFSAAIFSSMDDFGRTTTSGFWPHSRQRLRQFNHLPSSRRIFFPPPASAELGAVQNFRRASGVMAGVKKPGVRLQLWICLAFAKQSARRNRIVPC